MKATVGIIAYPEEPCNETRFLVTLIALSGQKYPQVRQEDERADRGGGQSRSKDRGC